MSILLLLLLPISILNAWLRLVGFGSHNREGNLVAVESIPLLARAYMHAVPVVVSILVGLALAIFDIVPWSITLIPVISGIVLIAVPLRYTLTDIGIQRTHASFRRWTEFAGVERARGGAKLKPLPRTRPARIWLSGSRGDDEFLQLIRTLIRNAYQGRSEVTIPATREPQSPVHEHAMTLRTQDIAAFKRVV